MQDETALYGAKMMQPGMTAADSEENNLRPQHLEDYIGQEKVKQNLKIYLEAAKRRGRAGGPHPALRPAGPGQDHAGRASSPTRWGCRSASPAARPSKSPATLPPC